MTDLSLKLQRTTEVDENTSHVLFRAGGAVTHSNIEQCVASLWDTKVRILEKSAYRPNGVKHLLGGFVTLNRESRPYEEASMDSFRCIAANVFIDENEFIWKVTGHDDSRMLVKDVNDDLDSIFQQRKAYSIDTASVNVLLGEKFTAGETILWFDTQNEVHRTGIAVNTDYAFELKTKTLHPVPDTTVLVVCDAETTTFTKEVSMGDIEQKEPLRKDNAIHKHVLYMKNLYKRNPEYFDRLSSMVESHYGEHMALI